LGLLQFMGLAQEAVVPTAGQACGAPGVAEPHPSSSNL